MAADPSLVIRVAANLAELKRNLAEGKNQIETTTSAMTKLGTSFSGDRLIQAAHNVAAAVGQIGNVSKLTEAEQARVNRTVEAALEKYKALGVEAPQALRDLAAQTAHATEKTSVLTRGAQALIAAFSVRAIVNAARDVMEFSGSLTDLAGKTGIGVEALQRLSYVTGQSGVSLEQVARGAVMLGKHLVEGNSSAVAAVEALHLNVQELIRGGPEQAFLAIGEAIAKVPNPMEQAALATAIFGKAGADYLPAFTADMAALAQQAQDSGAILSTDLVKAGDDAGDALGRLGAVGMALTGKVLLPMMPAIESVANWLGGALTASLDGARAGIDWLLRKGLELQVWLFDTAVAVSDTVREVPVLGRVFGQSAADVGELRTQAQFARDALNSFNAQGVRPVTEAVQAAGPLTTTFAESVEKTGRAARIAGQAIADEFIGPLQAESALVTRSLGETAALTRQLEAWARTNGAVLAPSIRQVNAALEAQEPLVSRMQWEWAQFAPTVEQNVSASGSSISGFFSDIFGGAENLGQSITSIFQSAFSGGGGALGAVQSFATQALSTLLGMIPGIGSWMSMLAGPIMAGFSKLWGFISDGFRRLFGGPSADELAGRELVAKFEDNVIAMLTDAQRMEAGTDRWRQVLIGVRDAVMAAGMSHEDALKLVERLWASSREGGEASRLVIEEITRLMQGQASAAVEGIDAIGEAINRIPTERRIRFTTEYEDDGGGSGHDPGYATGTLGRHGRWFGDFGGGTLTVLHGREAVVTPEQAPAFARAMGGGNDEVVRLLRDMPRMLKIAMREMAAMS